MKKLLLISLMFANLIFCNADSFDITAQYKEVNNTTVYSSKIGSNKTSFAVYSNNIEINTNSSLNGLKMVLIKLSNESYDWLSTINGKKDYYYLGILDNNNFISTQDIKSINCKNKIITVYDTDGKIINSQKDEVALSTSDIYLSFESIDNESQAKTINLIIDGKGKVIINNKIYTNNVKINLQEQKLDKIIVMSDSNYMFEEALINNENHTNNFINNELEYSFKNNDTLTIKFTSKPIEDENYLINISGYLEKNGLPIQNAKIILHSKELVAITDNEGFYELNGVSLGNHEMLILAENGEFLGYSQILLKQSNNSLVHNEIEQGKNIVEINNLANYNINLNINDKRKVIVKNLEEKNNTNNDHIEKVNNKYYLFLLIIPIIIVIYIINKRKNK